MAKVTNLTARTVRLHHWKVLPFGCRLLDPQGTERETMPDELAYSKAGKFLADQGQLDIEGYIVNRGTVRESEVLSSTDEEAPRKRRKKSAPEE